MFGGDAGRTAAVYGRCDGSDGLDELRGGLVRRAGGGDDAVPVELGAGEDLHVVGGVLQGNLVLLHAQILQDLAGRCLQAGTVGIIDVEVFQFQGIGLVKENIGILDDAREPLGGLDDFIHADSAVLVDVDHLQGLGVEFQAFGGTAEDRPHLAVQLIKVADVLAAGDFYADRAAYG